MPDTETDNHTLRSLVLLSERSRQEPSCRFTSLAHLLDEGFLQHCYFGLGRDRASGIDGVSWTEYGEHLEDNLRDLVTRLKAKRYKPQPARRVYIPKDGHGQRPLGLPALEDKIVQKGMACILEAIYEADFLDCSHSFRPGRSAHDALDMVDKTIMGKPINHVAEADIQGFFDAVSHVWMEAFLRERIVDPSFLLLIRRFLQAGYVDSGLLVVNAQGVPQGGNLSPILSNIFLHYVLDLWFEKRLKRQVRGACFLVRYADDFVCLIQYQEDAQQVEQALRERFIQFDLTLHPEKTRVVSFGRYERENAQRQQRRAHTFAFLGFTHFCGVSRRGKFIVGRRTSRKKFRQKAKVLNTWLKQMRNALPVKEWWPILASKLRGHYQYYGVSGNMPSLRRFYVQAIRLTLKWLNRRSQRRSFNWAGFRAYLEHYPLPQPRIVHNLYTLSPIT